MRVSAHKLLELARQELGVTEQPAGSNRVKYNTDYYGRQVSGDSYAWCCVFLWWLFRQAGAPELFYGGQKTAYCPALLSHYRLEGQTVAGPYEPGDILFFNFSGGTGASHVGILERDHGQTVTTIDGNTGTGDEANGGAVMRRTRSKKYIVGAARPAYAAQEESMTQEQFDRWMENWLTRRGEQEPSDWAGDFLARAQQEGIMDGRRPGAFATREEVAAMVVKILDR